jgi:UDP-N-acetylmuramyl tripeptide synthase
MLKTTLAIGAGKLTASLVSGLKLGAGTSLPGKVARRIDPALLQVLGGQIREQTIAVTGTNGKTTTCGLLARMLEVAGKKVFHNQLGANMVPGITSAMLRQSTLLGRMDVEYGVLEVDEASLRGVTREVPVHRVVVTNLFRDQLDRYGELDTTARMIADGIAQSQGPMVLNGDDPLVCVLGHGRPDVQYFGIEQVRYAHEVTLDETVGFPVEVSTCPLCGASIVYNQVLYGHLGHFHCSACSYQRPTPQVVAKDVQVFPAESQIVLQYGEEQVALTLTLPGLFNVYNFLAAAAVLHGLGFPSSVLTEGLSSYQSVFGRAEKVTIQGKTVMVMLIKNPVGASEVLKLVGGDPKGRLMIALNDGYADGRDVSWIWDAMFEVIPPDKPVVVSGVRAEDMAVRLKYAGVPEEHIRICPSLEAAMETALGETQVDETLYVLPTYTALLALRSFFNHL